MGLNRLTRYLLRELLLAWAAVTLVLVVVLLTNRLIQFMADAASGEIPPSVIFTLLGLKAAANIGVVLPGSFFLAVVLALGRFYRDSEITAMAGCGIGPNRIYRGIFALAVPLALGVAVLTLSLGPAAERQADRVLANAEQQARFGGVQPGRFLNFGDQTTVYVGQLGADGGMQGLFAERRVDGQWQIWVAEGGRRVANALGPGEFLVLDNGWRYDGNPGEAAWRVMEYAEHGIRVAMPAPVEPGVGMDSRGATALIEQADAAAWAELQRRLSPAVMLLVLALAGLPLAQSAPRSGRFGRVVIAVLVFMIYFNLIYTAADWLESGRVGLLGGPVWVHGLALLITVAAVVVRLGVSPLRRWQPGAAG
ncbi:LPS export ABC transporter permease LptF [Spiribacter pallidus]|uniref:LPS export ABC transporter permease LptF n=1 Tax=Spiribacter pallidus TaxID=1987936 RepID=UPI00349F3568